MSYHPDLALHVTKVFSNSSVKKQIHSIVYFDKKIPKKISIVAEKVRGQCLDIYEALKPLSKMGVNFEMWLVGGSVRDLLLERYDKISDLDICISFRTHSMSRQVSPKLFMKHAEINAEDFPLIAWKDGDRSKSPFSHWDVLNKNIKYSKKNKAGYELNEKIKRDAYTGICYEMLYCLLSKSFDLYQSYEPKISKNEINLDNQYASHRIDGVIKIRSSKWSWTSDILISKDHPQKFIDSFDFGICKVGIELVKPHLSQYNVEFFPKNLEDFYLRVHFTKEFLNDIKAKQHIIRIENHASTYDIQRSLEKHLPKIQSKYDWPVVFKEPIVYSSYDSNNGIIMSYGDDIGNIEEKISTVNTFLQKQKLEKILEGKEQSSLKLVKI